MASRRRISFCLIILFAGAVDGATLAKSWTLVRDVSAGVFRCRYYVNPHARDEGRAAIWKHGRLLFNEEYDPENDYIPPPGSEVTGDGIPDKVILEWYLIGMHTFFRYKISPGWDSEKTFIFESMRSELTFADLDHDGVMEAAGEDWSLEYWLPGYALSPHPRYVIRFSNDGEYRVALDLMKRPAPGAKEFRRRLEELRAAAGAAAHSTMDSDFASECAPLLWGYLFELIFQGNGRSARRFYDLVWAERRSLAQDPLFRNPANRKRFLCDFRNELTMSRFYFEILEFNRWRSEDDF